jgi:hypothetical protein
MLNEGRLAKEVRSYGVVVKAIPESHCSLLQILSEATRYLRSRDGRILHSHRYKENLLAALLAWRCKVPLVVRTQHGLAEPFGEAKPIQTPGGPSIGLVCGSLCHRRSRRDREILRARYCVLSKMRLCAINRVSTVGKEFLASLSRAYRSAWNRVECDQEVAQTKA